MRHANGDQLLDVTRRFSTFSGSVISFFFFSFLFFSFLFFSFLFFFRPHFFESDVSGLGHVLTWTNAIGGLI